ncbi:TDP-4-oxo-6-deoxy-alpha-D-glucose-3,4-oxoisomerase [compost metagenome]
MPALIKIPTFSDDRGSLSVIEKMLPFAIKRVFFLHDLKAPRGGHGHIRCQIALIALSGSIDIYCQTPRENLRFTLDTADKCLLLDPVDWHLIDKFSENVTVLALASHEFDKEDYFFEKYR